MRRKEKSKLRRVIASILSYVPYITIGAILGAGFWFLFLNDTSAGYAKSSTAQHSIESCYDETVYATVEAKILTEIDDREWEALARAHMEILRDLEDSRWETLTQIEKLNVLQHIANIESTYLGLSVPVRIGTVPLHERVGGIYMSRENVARLNQNRFDTKSSESLVITVLHEMAHAKQFEYIKAMALAKEFSNLQIFNEARVYAEGFEQYIYDKCYDDEEQMSHNRNTSVEIAAREYSENYIRYFELITERQMGSYSTFIPKCVN
jgi:hypothetical protein